MSVPSVQRTNVVAQKIKPGAVIEKKAFGKGFSTTIVNVLEDGTELPYRISGDTKKELLKDLAKLPIENVKAMWVEDGRVLLELIKYNGL